MSITEVIFTPQEATEDREGALMESHYNYSGCEIPLMNSLTDTHQCILYDLWE